jgi:NAD-dependent SIR2 family protein deacetylase
MSTRSIFQAVEAINDASAIIFTAGAGMGVDSGLPDFRGTEGFWRAYPALKELDLSFSDIANPAHFKSDPELAWGFYGHRMMLYRDTTPHAGFDIMKGWSELAPHFVYTSNVDGAFQKSGFDEGSVWECHGSINWLQPTEGLGIANFNESFEEILVDSSNYDVEVDMDTFRAKGELPKHPETGQLLRPNILMFGDYGFNPMRESRQRQAYEKWVETTDLSKLVVVECGAGSVIPSVRMFGEDTANHFGGTLIRINNSVSDARAGDRHISICMGAKDALVEIQRTGCGR